MSTFRDFLIFYNNLDVKPFVEAIQKMKKNYSEKGVDVFKDDISVPGIARKLLFETSENNNTSFSLFDESNKDLYQTIKQNIVGGPSIVFHRYHSVNETLIRNMTKCRNIVGYDANALYLYCLGLDMPVDKFYRRKSSTNFSPEKDNRLFSMYEWLDYLNLPKIMISNIKKNLEVMFALGLILLMVLILLLTRSLSIILVGIMVTLVKAMKM